MPTLGMGLSLVRKFSFASSSLIDDFVDRVLLDGGIVDTVAYLNNTESTATLIMNPSAYKDGILYAFKPNDGSGDFTFTRGSAGARVNKLGFLEEVVGVDTPRITYEGGIPALLMEDESTNYSKNSEQPSTWHSSNKVTITANATNSPEGIQNASLVVTNATQPYVRNLFTFDAGVGLTQVTVSYFIKYYNNQWVRLRAAFFNGSPANNLPTWFDIQNGVVGTVNANHTAQISDEGDGWYRCSITFDIDKTTDTNGYSLIEPMIGDNINTYAAIGQGFYGYGSQGENGILSSYIPTTTAIKTRLEDVATRDLTGLGITSITETINGVVQTPITTIPTIYSIPKGKIQLIEMN